MKNQSVLIVDDEKNIRLTLRETLKTFDLNVDAAVNGEEALNMAAQQTYDLVLLDIRMPGMDGIEVLRRLRELSQHTAVILLTAHGTVETAVEAMKLGAVDFLQKPFAPQEIRDIVEKALGRKKNPKNKSEGYNFFTASARKQIRDRLLDIATEEVKTAISIDPSRPEAFNLMGAISELQQDISNARKYYRTAYWLDPLYEPSRLNIERNDIGKGGMDAIHLD